MLFESSQMEGICSVWRPSFHVFGPATAAASSPPPHSMLCVPVYLQIDGVKIKEHNGKLMNCFKTKMTYYSFMKCVGSRLP